MVPLGHHPAGGIHYPETALPGRQQAEEPVRLTEQRSDGAIQRVNAAKGNQRDRQGQAAHIEQQGIEGLLTPTAAGHRSSRLRGGDRKSTRLNSSHVRISYAVF